MKLYTIAYEPAGFLGSDRYRFVSLYNSARGPWRTYRESAINDGKEHQEVIELLHGDKLTMETGQPA